MKKTENFIEIGPQVVGIFMLAVRKIHFEKNAFKL